MASALPSTLLSALDAKLEQGNWSALKTLLYEACDVTRHRAVYEWVVAKAQAEGHCLLQYLVVRNAFKQHALYTPAEFDARLAEALFFLVRVAEDCVAARRVNGFTRAPDLFSLFHGKLRRWLVPYEASVGAVPAKEGSWISAALGRAAAPEGEWPGVGEVFNAWPPVSKVVQALKQLCKERPVATHVKTHWAWCLYTQIQWVDTIAFGSVPREICDTYATNLAAAQDQRAKARAMVLGILSEIESWESFWAMSPHTWTHLPGK